MTRVTTILSVAGLITVLALGVAFAEPRKSRNEATFALVVGSNHSVDRELKPLRYADDDAARYFDLFRALGFRTYLLMEPDANTRRLHVQAAAEAQPPQEAALLASVEQLKRDIAQARGRNLRTMLYLIYAGHGNVKEDRGYITLEDARFDAKTLREKVIDPIDADQVHLIIDACYSFFLAHSRGPGGKRRSYEGFLQLKETFPSERIGLLLSTSSARESHEWDAFQSGVFSHEVRSGLYGAADANGDDQVTYREMAAFVARANAAVPNERYRPRIFARPPQTTQTLLDLRSPDRRYLEIPGSLSGRYFLEDKRGVRLVDFHSSARQSLRITRPASAGSLYLRRLSDGFEYEVPSNETVARLATLEAKPARAEQRGSAHEAFSTLFSLAFDDGIVETVDLAAGNIPTLTEQQDAAGVLDKETILWTSLGVGAASLAGAVAMTIVALNLDGDREGRSQVEIQDRHQDATALMTGAYILYGVVGASAIAAALTYLFWDDGPDEEEQAPMAGVGFLGDGALLQVGGRF